MITNKNEALLLKLIKEKNIDKIKSLLIKDISCPIEFALKMVSIHGYTEILTLLLKHGNFKKSEDNSFSICLASEFGYFDIVQMLLNDQRIDPSLNYNSAIENAYEGNHINVVKLLLKDLRVKNLINESVLITYNKAIAEDTMLKLSSFDNE
jgi:hypothetical protein